MPSTLATQCWRLSEAHGASGAGGRETCLEQSGTVALGCGLPDLASLPQAGAGP